MIYTVDCAFTDPSQLSAWNAYYDDKKLPALLTLPGFRASQRFRAITEAPAPYLALHSIRDAAVLDQAVYRDVGGGTFGGWEHSITNWDRNLFTGMEAAPEVSSEQCLVLLDDRAAAGTVPGTEFIWLDIVGLDRTTSQRGLAIVDGRAGERLARDNGDIVRVFTPIGRRQVSKNGIDG
jgi:hypothetical protein